ncbi:MAG: PLP-dependent transferase [Promethearchaeota archaeon]|jgi:cystathionine beta-lyase/cystathionine gamma-synthase
MGSPDFRPKLKLVKSIGGFHGVSAIFPTLKDVIDYEEKKIIVNHGYPRFVSHLLVKKIENKYKRQFDQLGAVSCHSYETAVFLVMNYFFKKDAKIFYEDPISTEIYDFLISKFPNVVQKSSYYEADILIIEIGSNRRIVHDEKNDVGIILFRKIQYAIFEIIRRHYGFNISSRKLSRREPISKNLIKSQEAILKKRIADLENGDKEYCFLYPSGMAAIFSSLLSVISEKKPKLIALGSLYVDTLRILELWSENYNLSKSIFIRENFENTLTNSIDVNTAGVIFEFPSNPLIQLLDIEKIVEISHSKGAKVIVDNTIATPFNFKPFNFDADIIVHSTTKFLSGKNNHIGGVILVKDEVMGGNLKILNKLIKLDMHYNDINVLLRNVRKFETRMQVINSNTQKVAEFLNQHKSIKKVYYPCLKNSNNYDLMKRYLRGGSGLLSFVLKNSTLKNAENFYDNILPPILKGPSLGSEKTLLSPYVIMAHYDDPRTILEQLGLDFYLMRLSVGMESSDQIISSLNYALEFVE